MSTRGPQRLTAFANAILDDLRLEPATPMSAAVAGATVGLTGWEAGQRLRELHVAGFVTAHFLSPTGGKRIWRATDAGRAHVIDLSGIEDEIATLEDTREARRRRSRRRHPAPSAIAA